MRDPEIVLVTLIHGVAAWSVTDLHSTRPCCEDQSLLGEAFAARGRQLLEASQFLYDCRFADADVTDHHHVRGVGGQKEFVGEQKEFALAQLETITETNTHTQKTYTHRNKRIEENLFRGEPGRFSLDIVQKEDDVNDEQNDGSDDHTPDDQQDAYHRERRGRGRRLHRIVVVVVSLTHF